MIGFSRIGESMSSGGIQNKYSAGSQASLGTAFTAIELTADSSLGGQKVAAQCYLDKIFFTWKSISTAVNFTWYLAYDDGGQYPITDPQEAVVFKVGKTGTTKVNAADLSGASYIQTIQGQTIFLIAKVNAGTVNLDAVMIWRGR